MSRNTGAGPGRGQGAGVGLMGSFLENIAEAAAKAVVSTILFSDADVSIRQRCLLNAAIAGTTTRSFRCCVSTPQ